MSVIFPSEFGAKIFGNEGVHKFSKQIERLDDPQELIYIADYRLYRSKLGATITRAAMGLETQDTASADYDMAHKAASSYYRGAMFAMGGLWRLIAEEQRHTMSAIALPETVAAEASELVAHHHKDAEVYLGIGRIGFTEAAVYHELFSEYEEDISRNNETLGAARAGFGLPFYILSTAIEAELADMVNTTSSEAWDTALAELIGKQEN